MKDVNSQINAIMLEESDRLPAEANAKLKILRAEDPARPNLICDPNQATRLDVLLSDPICLNDCRNSALFTQVLTRVFNNLYQRILDEEDRLRGCIEVAIVKWRVPDPRHNDELTGCFEFLVKIPE